MNPLPKAHSSPARALPSTGRDGGEIVVCHGFGVAACLQLEVRERVCTTSTEGRENALAES